MTLLVCKQTHVVSAAELELPPYPESESPTALRPAYRPFMDYSPLTILEEDIAMEEPRGEARKEGGKRGRKPGRKVAPDRVDMKAKLERSRQSARECRARKKLRYQYLEELVLDREKAVFALRKEFEKYHNLAKEIEEGRITEDVQQLLEEMGVLKKE